MTAQPSEDPLFVEFWKIYPRKDAKGAARRAFAKACTKATAAEIIAGVKRYPFSPDPQFRPMPATWLNDERWTSEDPTTPPTVAAAAQSRSSWRDKYEQPAVPRQSFPEQRAIRADEPFTIEGSLFDE